MLCLLLFLHYCYFDKIYNSVKLKQCKIIIIHTSKAKQQQRTNKWTVQCNVNLWHWTGGETTKNCQMLEEQQIRILGWSVCYVSVYLIIFLQKDPEQLQEDLENERVRLARERQKQERIAVSITDVMYAESKVWSNSNWVGCLFGQNCMTVPPSKNAVSANIKHSKYFH